MPYVAFEPDNFEISRQRNALVFWVGTVGLTACGLVVLLGLLRGRRLALGSLPAVRGIAPAICSLCGCGPRDEKTSGAFNASVREELDQKRLARARRMIPWAQIFVVSNFLLFAVRVGLIGDPVARIASTTQDIAMCVFSAMISIMWASNWAFVSVVTLRSLDFWFSAMMSCLVVYMSPFAIRADLVAYRLNFVYVMSLFCCLFNLNPWVNIPWLLLITIMSSYTLMFGDRFEEIHDGDYNAQQVLTDSVQNASLVVLLLLFLNRLLAYIVRLELEAKFSRNELAAATSVLHCVCEVVVDLDEKFRLQRHSRELADMLFLNPQRQLDQEDIRLFMASESDRSKFTEQMGRLVLPDSREDSPKLSNTFQVMMKDSTGVSLNVHVIAVSYLSRDGLPAFLVGILEVSDSISLPCLQGPAEATGRRRGDRRPRPRAAGPPGAARRPPPGPPEEAQEAEDSSGSGSGSASGSDWGSVDPKLVEGEPLSVWLDVVSPGYRMLHFSASFQQLFEPCRVGDEFLAWVKPGHREHFVRWTQESWILLDNPIAGDASIEIYSRALHFLPTQLRRRRLAFSATVVLDLAPAPAATRGSAVRMTLSNVRPLTPTAGGGRRQRRGVAPPPPEAAGEQVGPEPEQVMSV